MYKLYFRDTNKKRINEEPLIIETMPLYGTIFCLSLKEDAVTMRVKDTIKIIGPNDLTDGYSYYLDVSPCQNSLSSVRDFTKTVRNAHYFSGVDVSTEYLKN